MRKGPLLGTLVLLLTACSVPISAGLDEGDATSAVVALEKSGIAAEKEKDPDHEGRYRVLVGRDDAAGALTVMSQEGLPPRETPGVLDALGKGSLVPSRLSEQAKLVAGTSGDLERTLRGVDGIVSARVHLAVPPRDPLETGAEPASVSASVLLRHRGTAPPIAAPEVQRLVAGAVPGLDPRSVSVVMTPAPPRARQVEHELARMGPLTVTRASMTPLRVVVGIVILVNVVLLGSLFALFSRLRKLEGELVDATRTDERSKR